ncbi:hypothetical protein DUNSADRAFT_1871 [Dunaliella salina]|uniref:Uncharacterized protein n=1 Tax=Dunaliella salina TaxID=3046 RepID=A0ABQ7FWX9_DUNSA|nr:hypothetical protein DUNSADRAFT_1871 [Dunaliella salina]|eukprot:KAF5826862.1 hypothetical protein DUNSADRAFT_1871 [Dunaliella salina]
MFAVPSLHPSPWHPGVLTTFTPAPHPFAPSLPSTFAAGPRWIALLSVTMCIHLAHATFICCPVFSFHICCSCWTVINCPCAPSVHFACAAAAGLR